MTFDDLEDLVQRVICWKNYNIDKLFETIQDLFDRVDVLGKDNERLKQKVAELERLRGSHCEGCNMHCDPKWVGCEGVK